MNYQMYNQQAVVGGQLSQQGGRDTPQNAHDYQQLAAGQQYWQNPAMPNMMYQQEQYFQQQLQQQDPGQYMQQVLSPQPQFQQVPGQYMQQVPQAFPGQVMQQPLQQQLGQYRQQVPQPNLGQYYPQPHMQGTMENQWNMYHANAYAQQQQQQQQHIPSVSPSPAPHSFAGTTIVAPVAVPPDSPVANVPVKGWMGTSVSSPREAASAPAAVDRGQSGKDTSEKFAVATSSASASTTMSPFRADDGSSAILAGTSWDPPEASAAPAASETTSGSRTPSGSMHRSLYGVRSGSGEEASGDGEGAEQEKTLAKDSTRRARPGPRKGVSHADLKLIVEKVNGRSIRRGDQVVEQTPVAEADHDQPTPPVEVDGHGGKAVQRRRGPRKGVSHADLKEVVEKVNQKQGRVSGFAAYQQSNGAPKQIDKTDAADLEEVPRLRNAVTSPPGTGLARRLRPLKANTSPNLRNAALASAYEDNGRLPVHDEMHDNYNSSLGMQTIPDAGHPAIESHPLNYLSDEDI